VTSIPGALGLHHVGIVVDDLDAAMAQYARLGFQDPERFVMESQGIEAVTYRTGAGYVELIHPTDPEGPIARFLAKRGSTVHHMAMRVDDLEGTLARLAADGVRLIDASPRTGAHGWRIAFLHPESCNGVLIELVDDRQ
jgi:methylmalonyl-CoA/ethylmalonyl-CoA epimerase